MKSVFEAEGEIREVDPLAALVTCWRERTSGALRFARGAAECGFDLEEGEVVGVVSSDPRFETAAILVRAGKLAAEAVERLAPQGGDPALAALQTGLLTRREWKWGEKIRAIEVLSDLLAWNDGRYRFDTQARPAGGDFRLPVPRLLLELFLRSRDRNLVNHQLGSPEQALVRAERFDEEFPSFGLTADAESVVRLIDGRSTAAEITQRAPAEEFAVRKLLAALVTLGLVHPVPARPGRPPEGAPQREPEPEPTFPPAERAAEREPEEFAASPELPPPRRESLPPDLPVAPPSGAEREMVELPSASASPLDRFEPSPTSSGWEPGPAPAPPRPEELWGAAPGILAAPEREETPTPTARRGGVVLAWALGVLLAAVAGIILLRSRGPAPTPAAPGANPTPVPAVTFPPPVTAAGVQAAVARPAAVATAAPAAPTAIATAQRAAETTSIPARAPKSAARATPAPVAGVSAPPAARASPTPAGSSAEPASGSRETWARRAERDRRRLDSDRRSRYAIQLELVCEVPSLQEAWRHDRGQSMWLLSVAHGGRDCFRVFWGRYPTIEAARKAKAAIPSYFVTARNRPAVVAVR